MTESLRSRVPLEPEGVGLAVIGAATTALGVTADWRSLALVGVVLLVLVALGIALVFRRSSVTIRRIIDPPRVERGDPAVIYLELANRGTRRSPASTAQQVFGSRVLTLDLPRLAGGEQGIRVYRLPTETRGVFLLPPIEVRREDPLRLARTVRPEGEPAEVRVTPRIRPMPGLARGITVAVEGADAKLAQQGTIVFHHLREYVDGDDLRLVHWPSSAKTGQLVVRHHVDVTEASALVVLDDAASSYADSATFEEALDVCASALSSLAHESISSWLVTTSGREVSLGRGQALPEALDLLTELEPVRGPRLVERAAALVRDPRGTSAILVTGPFEPDDIIGLAPLASRFAHVISISLGGTHASARELAGILVVEADSSETAARMWARSADL